MFLSVEVSIVVCLSTSVLTYYQHENLPVVVVSGSSAIKIRQNYKQNLQQLLAIYV